MAVKDAPKPSLTVASVVAVEPNEPYPEGSPPDPAAVVARVHPPQEITEAAYREAQSAENLAAGGMIAGAEAYEPPAPPEPEPPEPEEDDSLRVSRRPTGGKTPARKV